MSKIKKLLLGITFGAFIGAAIAAAPGPTTRGEFYYYFDNTGKVIGYRAINCNGTFASWGKTSSVYANGYMLCLPVD